MILQNRIFKYLVLFILIMMVIVLGGRAKKSSYTGTSDDNSGKDDLSKYKLLYNPPAGGNPENKGKIVFASDPGETTQADYDLFTINPDGSNKHKLTTFGKYIDHPVWSPEYSRIAYSKHVDEGNTDKIFIMTADGKESRQLTFGEGRDKFPTWSPDGKQIAYISYREDRPNLFIMDTYGKNTKQLTFVTGKDTVLWPSWSPVSDVIAFSYNKAGDEIDFRLHTIKADGTGEREILSSTDPDLSDHEPGWSPDGNIIYFISNRTSHLEIWKVNYAKLAASNFTNYNDIDLKQVSNLHNVNTTPDHRPRVSPDGKKIVFYGVGPDWNNIGTNLYTLNVDGTDLTNITKSIDGNEWPDW
jgi:Tol biopolymer transport system component